MQVPIDLFVLSILFVFIFCCFYKFIFVPFGYLIHFLDLNLNLLDLFLCLPSFNSAATSQNVLLIHEKQTSMPN